YLRNGYDAQSLKMKRPCLAQAKTSSASSWPTTVSHSSAKHLGTYLGNISTRSSAWTTDLQTIHWPRQKSLEYQYLRTNTRDMVETCSSAFGRPWRWGPRT